MRIGILSDTHGYMDDRILHHLADCDQIWHAGDIGALDVCGQLMDLKPLVAVHGNIDGQSIRAEYPEFQYFQVEGQNVLLTHIIGKPPSYTQKVRQRLAEHQVDILVGGHSHILKVVSDKPRNMLVLNPGAAGRHGFHKVRTILKLKIERTKISDLQAIELGKRASVV